MTQSGRLRARWDLRLVAAGALAVCVGGVGAVWLYANLSQTDAVVLIKRTVYREQVIAEADLTVVAQAPAPGVRTVPADRLAEVVGKTARLDLAEGSLLSPGSYGEALVVPGTVRLGLRLAAGRLPGLPLPPGAPVLLVAVVPDSTQPPSVAGQVAAAGIVQPDGAWVVDVAVAADQGELVARLAATDQLVLVAQADEAR